MECGARAIMVNGQVSNHRRMSRAGLDKTGEIFFGHWEIENWM